MVLPAKHRLGIGWRPSITSAEDPPGIDSPHPRQRLPQLIPLAVVADNRHGPHATDAEGYQVIDNRPRRSGAGPHAHDLVGVEAGFDGRFRQKGVDVEIAVEE